MAKTKTKTKTSTKLYKNWWVHNIVAHPLMQILKVISVDLANKLHDSTLPD